MPFNETGYVRDRDELGRIKPSKIDGNNSLKVQAKVENKIKVPEKYPTFTDYASLSKWEKFKNININLKAYIIFLTGGNTHKEIRQNFISWLARYIDKNNNINKEQIDRIYHHAKVSFENHKRAKENTKKRKCFQKIAERINLSVYPFNTVSSLFGIREPHIRPPRANTDIWRTNTTSNKNSNINPENRNISQDTDNTNKALNNEEINNSQEVDDTDNSKKSATSNENETEEINTEGTEGTEETGETDETEKRIIDNLKDLKIDEAEKLLNWGNMSLKSCKWLNLKELFIFEKGFKVENGCVPHLEEDFQAWNNKRLDNISKLFTPTHMELLTDSDQLLKASDILSPDFIDKWVNFKKSLEWVPETEWVVYDFETSRDADNELARYTHGEILWEMVSRLDMRDGYPLRLLQTFITSYLKKENIYDTRIITWEWNAETQKFLEDTLNDPKFKKEINYKKYEQAIYKVLSSHRHFDTSSLISTFESFSEHSKRNEDYWENPESYWRNQTLEWPREFVWVTNLWNRNSYKLEEQSFLNNHMQEFNGKLAEFLKIPQLKEWDSIDENSRTKMEQIWKTIPLEQINAIYDLFASNPEEQKKFKNFLNDNNLQDIDINDLSLKRLILEQNYSFNPIAKYCYDRIWISFQNEILSESWKTLQYLSDKTWDTALNIKNNVLKFFLTDDISIRPEKAENGIFYFRDENNLDTLYSFNPENWEIYQHGNISLEDEGIISLKPWWSKGELLQKIKWFENMIDIDILDVLPNKHQKNMDDLEKQILNNIKSKITIENVSDTRVVNKDHLELRNKRNVCYNAIVWDLKQLLNIEDDNLYETDWEKYKIFYNLIKTFEKIDIEHPNIDIKNLDNTFNLMKLFFDKIRDSIGGFKLLKPSLLDKNWDLTEEPPQENADWKIQNSQETEQWLLIVKNLIDPNTLLFDINLIIDLANNSEVDHYLSEGKIDRVIWEIQKNKELKVAEEEYEQEIAHLYNNTRDNLDWLKRDVKEDAKLFETINSLENEGYILS